VRGKKMKKESTNIHWTRSSHCSSHTCVEVSIGSNRVSIRDSKNNQISSQETIDFEPGEWAMVLRLGFHPSTGQCGSSRVVTRSANGRVEVLDTHTDTLLNFSREEWHAFLAGVADGEFDLSAAA